MCLLRGVTVSLVSPSFMRRMSLAASRFLSRLQSSFRDTNPPRSSFSTYCNTHTHTHTHTRFNTQWFPPKLLAYFLSWTYMSILGIIEEKQWIPAQTGPQPPGSLSHTDTNTHICLMGIHLPLFYDFHISCPKRWIEGWVTAAVSLRPWISAVPCTWAGLTLHVYIALKWA